MELEQQNEANIIYDMIKASTQHEGIFNYPSTLKGMEAAAVVSGKSIILTYADGIIATYTEE